RHAMAADDLVADLGGVGLAIGASHDDRGHDHRQGRVADRRVAPALPGGPDRAHPLSVGSGAAFVVLSAEARPVRPVLPSEYAWKFGRPRRRAAERLARWSTGCSPSPGWLSCMTCGVPRSGARTSGSTCRW